MLIIRQININHICITNILIADISTDPLRMRGNHPLLWKHLDLGFLLLADPNGPSRCMQCCPALPLACFYFLFLSAPVFGVYPWLHVLTLIHRGSVLWLCNQSRLPFLPYCLLLPLLTPSSVCLFDLVAFAAWSKRFSVSESNVTYLFVPGLFQALPIKGGDGTDLIPFQLQTRVELEGKTSAWSNVPSDVHASIPRHSFCTQKCFWQFIGKSGRC